MSARLDLQWNDGEAAWIGDIATPNIRARMCIHTGSHELRPSARACDVAQAKVAKLDLADQKARAYLADRSRPYILDKYGLVARPGLFALLAVEIHVNAPDNEYALRYAIDRDPSRLWRVTLREVTPHGWMCIPSYGM
jgi:hypothetical protein